MSAKKWITPEEFATLHSQAGNPRSKRAVQDWLLRARTDKKWEVKQKNLSFRFRQAKSSKGGGRSGTSYEISLDSLPLSYQYAYIKRNIPVISAPSQPNTGIKQLSLPEQLDAFESHPKRKKDRALDRLNYLNATDGLTKEGRKRHWAEHHHAFPTIPKMPSEKTVQQRWKADLKKNGLVGLIPGWRGPTSSVPEKAGEFFASLALDQAERSYNECYRITLGWYREEVSKDGPFPSLSAFERWVTKKYPKPYRELARKGPSHYVRTHQYYIDRDASDIPAGKGWYSDHHQLDTRVQMPDGRLLRPWLTAWMDARTAKMVGWHLHEDAPNSDHIFYSFYLAVKEHGLPDWIYLDNGKDYLCRDLTGKTHRKKPIDEIVERQSRSLMGLLRVKVILAEVKNAQAKYIERRFKDFINGFAKFMPGYVGSNPSKRPEKTEKQCAGGEILPFQDCKSLLDKYIAETFNNLPSKGKLLNGMSPNQAWEAYRGEIRTVSNESLRLCMMRTSKAMRIGRNGVIDRELGIELRYWAEWMPPMRGEYVYIRRDIENYGEAWAWNDKDDVYLGKATLAEKMPIQATGKIDRTRLKEEIRRKRADIKAARDAIRPKIHLDPSEIIDYQARGVAFLNEQKAETNEGLATRPAITPISTVQLTDLDTAHAEEKRRYRQGTVDMSLAVPPEPEKKQKLALFECDIEVDGEEYGTGTEG